MRVSPLEDPGMNRSNVSLTCLKSRIKRGDPLNDTAQSKVGVTEDEGRGLPKSLKPRTKALHKELRMLTSRYE